MNSHEVFIHIHQGCFAGTGAIVRLPQCQWSKPDGYGKISQCITTTKHSKAKTVCIFLGIYCTVQCHYNAVNFIKKIHKRHPITHPLGWGMGCLLWIQPLIVILLQFLQWCMQYLVILDHVIMALDFIKLLVVFSDDECMRCLYVISACCRLNRQRQWSFYNAINSHLFLQNTQQYTPIAHLGGWDMICR